MYSHERSLVKNLAGKPFALIGVNSRDKIERVKELVAEGVVTWRSFKNEIEDGTISESWEVNGWPTVYLLDAEGKIRFKNPQRGEGRIGDLDNAIAELLEEMGEDFPAEAIHASVQEDKDAEIAKKKKLAEEKKAKMEAAKKKAEMEAEDKKAETEESQQDDGDSDAAKSKESDDDKS